MGGEDLVVVMGRQIAGGIAKGHGLVQAHHDRVGEAAQQHHQPRMMYMMPIFVVNGGEPLVPQVAPQLVAGQGGERRDTTQCHHGKGAEDNRVMEGNRVPGKATKNQLGQVQVLKHGRHLLRLRSGKLFMVASMLLMITMTFMVSLGIAMVTGVLVHATVVHHVFHAGLAGSTQRLKMP